MKDIFYNTLYIVGSFAFVFILGWAILFPFAIGWEEIEWTGWVVYPLSVILIASKRKFHEFFNEKVKL